MNNLIGKSCDKSVRMTLMIFLRGANMKNSILRPSKSPALACAVLSVLLQAATVRADEATVSILEPKSGATVTSPFKVRLAAHSMTTQAAGRAIDHTGHHHLLINHSPIGKGKVIPRDETHIHLDQGQTETTLTLPPGKYKLTAQFADGEERSYGHMMAHGINITVK